MTDHPPCITLRQASEDRRPRRPRRGAVLAAAATAGVLGVACVPRVPVSPGDSSAPEEVRWTVFDGGVEVPISGNGTYTIRRGEEITVWFHAKDSQGLESISLSASTGWGCEGGGIGQTVGPGLAFPDSTTFTPDSNGAVPVSSIKVTTVGPGPYPCGAGLSFVGGTTSLRGRAASWGGGVTTATLDVSITP
jgi:hypothetical protein